LLKTYREEGLLKEKKMTANGEYFTELAHWTNTVKINKPGKQIANVNQEQETAKPARGIVTQKGPGNVTETAEKKRNRQLQWKMFQNIFNRRKRRCSTYKAVENEAK
jgi:macrodomain Ter protein organizer (MatP/YcbG family)